MKPWWLGFFALPAFADLSVTLAWDPNPEPDLSCYIIYWGLQERSYPWATNVGNVTTATVRGLPDDRPIHFAITAVNTSGIESDFSEEVIADIQTNRTVSVQIDAPVFCLGFPGLSRPVSLPEAFGSQLFPGNSPAEADRVCRLNRQTQRLEIYFRTEFPGFAGWWDSDFLEAGHVKIEPGEAVLLITLGPRPLALQYPARSLGGFPRMPTNDALICVSDPLVSVSLGALPAEMFAAGANPDAADSIGLISPEGAMEFYFRSAVPEFPGWYSADYLPASTIVLGPCEGFLYRPAQ